MPNKYSHAFVLSNYESHGLVDFDRPRPSKPSASSTSSRSNPKSQRNNVTTAPAKDYPPTPRYGKPERIRIGTPSPPPPPIRNTAKPTPPPLHRRTSSTETQIYAPKDPPTTPSIRRSKDKDAYRPSALVSPLAPCPHPSAVQSIPLPIEISPNSLPQEISFECSPSPPLTRDNCDDVSLDAARNTAQFFAGSQSISEQNPNPSIKMYVPKLQKPPIRSQKPNMRHSSAVAVGGLDHASSALQNYQADPSRGRRRAQGGNDVKQSNQLPYSQHAQGPLAVRAFAPEHPPSPPATPESDRSFSLQTLIEATDPISLPPPVPERSARRSPPGPTPGQNSPTATVSEVHPEPQRPKTSSAHPSSTGITFSTTTQKSSSRRPSVTACLSGPRPDSQRPRTSSTQASPTGTTFSITTRTSSFTAATSSWSPSRTLSMPSKAPADHSKVLPPLPGTSNMPSQPFFEDDDDLESLPSTLDSAILPWDDENISPAIFRDGELNSRRSSVAMPDSSRASSFDSVAPPPIGMHRRMPPVLTESPLPTTPKTPKKGKPSLASLAFFRSAPKAVFYSQTRPATPPVPVSVSRTAAPSIPALFPGYKGQFPPSREGERHSRPSRGTSREAPRRVQSVPPKTKQRRMSWFNNEQPDRSFGMPIKKKVTDHTD